ncbi:unnamed protein product [Owenia fusiformis]|uniref:Uncharacterized protein n=1 Tax=Owenia fusiformis TaxID=6347 RepID=A0A8J1U9R5_OWEFU|nr:unnamed protein product [Owenia fusiformis]
MNKLRKFWAVRNMTNQNSPGNKMAAPWVWHANLDFLRLFRQCWRVQRCVSHGMVAELSNSGRLLHASSSLRKSGHKSSNITKGRLSGFQARQDHLRRQARCSILVQVPSKTKCSSILQYCEKRAGKIVKAYHFSNSKDYTLIEFADESSVKNITKHARFFMPNKRGNQYYGTQYGSIPVQTRLMFYSGVELEKSVAGWTTSKYSVPFESETPPHNLIQTLQGAKNISQQMSMLYKQERLTELGMRLRFLHCTILEDLLTSIFPYVKINPFGSCVNGFGQRLCDLDMHMDIQPEEVTASEALNFLTKKLPENERIFTQHILNFLADIIQMFVPHSANVLRITHASVPIIKFYSRALDIDCDLSMGNRSGLYMSELLWFLGEIDPRVQPLVFTIRSWAKEQCLTQKQAPGRKPTNFTWTMLVIYFLQAKQVLPSIEILASLAGPGERKTIDGYDRSFSTDIHKYKQLNLKTMNVASVEELLIQFMEFYAKYDFSSQALSLRTGTSYTKESMSPMYIENPFEPDRNVSKNVSMEEIVHIQKACAKSVPDLKNSYKLKKLDQRWGLINLLSSQSHPPLDIRFKVQDLLTEDFDSEDGNVTSESEKPSHSKLESDPQANEYSLDENKDNLDHSVEDSRKGTIKS